jgi:hypothetical protein
MVDVLAEAGIPIEGLRAVDIRDRDDHDLELELHAPP